MIFFVLCLVDTKNNRNFAAYFHGNTIKYSVKRWFFNEKHIWITGTTESTEGNDNAFAVSSLRARYCLTDSSPHASNPGTVSRCSSPSGQIASESDRYA